MTSYLVQCNRVLFERSAQSFRADNLHLRLSQPDLFDQHWYIGNLPTMLSGIESSLQMLRDFQV